MGDEQESIDGDLTINTVNNKIYNKSFKNLKSATEFLKRVMQGKE